MIDLDEDVTRSSLKDCLDSGWTAQEIAEELGLDSVADVMRWCAYHDLATPWQAQHIAQTLRREERKAQAVRAKRVEQEARIKRAAARQERRATQEAERRAYKQTRSRYIPKPRTTPEYQRERHRINARNSKRSADAAVSAQLKLERAQRVAVYLLCGTYERTALICKCSPEGIKSSLHLAGVEPIAKRRPSTVEVERTMSNFSFGDDDIARAVKILTKK